MARVRASTPAVQDTDYTVLDVYSFSVDSGGERSQ